MAKLASFYKTITIDDAIFQHEFKKLKTKSKVMSWCHIDDISTFLFLPKHYYIKLNLYVKIFMLKIFMAHDFYKQFLRDF